jgi:hypothetical protein
VIEHRAFAQREDFDAALANGIDEDAPDLVVLAGFMRVLGPRSSGATWTHAQHPSVAAAVVSRLHTHRRALADGVRIHGCTVHFVTPKSTWDRSWPRPPCRCARATTRKALPPVCSRGTRAVSQGRTVVLRRTPCHRGFARPR